MAPKRRCWSPGASTPKAAEHLLHLAVGNKESEDDWTEFFRHMIRRPEAFDHPDGDRWDEIASAWIGKELLRDVYAAEGNAEAREALGVFYHWVEEVTVPELSRLARTIRQWEDEIIGYHQQRYSNAKTEAANLIIERQRRAAHGYRNFENYRLRLLLTHGVKWHTPPTTKIRGRRPPLVA